MIRTHGAPEKTELNLPCRIPNALRGCASCKPACANVSVGNPSDIFLLFSHCTERQHALGLDPSV